MVDKQEEIKKATIEEILITFYNGHLRDFLAATVRLKVAQNSEPNEMVGFRLAPPLGPNQQPMRIDMRAKEMIPEEEKTFNIQAKFLCAVEETSEEYKKNQTPWHIQK